ncbi:vea protein [Phlyctema vagabunda]|uniref:Vea protein n=1 Tax=Phlyctema vagabunda TaxID=108571 RepID=A0ABR4P7G8_9HELO
MSITEPSRGFAGQPPRRPSYSQPLEHSPYATESSDRGRMHLPPPPSLPSMSSLLRDEPGRPQYTQYNPYQPGPQHVQYSSNHPLFLSQQNPNAPPPHIYQSSQSQDQDSRAKQYLTDSHSSVPQVSPSHVSPSHDFPVVKEMEGYGAPLAQRRQSRKISQRRPDFPNDKSRTDGSSAPPPPSIRYDETIPAPALGRPETGLRRPSEASTGDGPQRSRPMPISRLLSTDEGTPTRPSGPTYKIRVRQQPLAARACGFGERDRRVIDPPPILQLSIEDPNATAGELNELLRQPYSVVHCTLWNPLTNQDDTAMPGSSDKRQQRRLMGTLVASPFVGQDEHDVEGCFFCFPDLSVRTAGTYSLKFSLVVLDPKKMMRGNSVPVRATVMSEAFQVYNAKDFIGMRASTELTKRLKHQGCLISVKKGNAKTNASHARDDDEDDDEDDDDENGVKQKGKRPRR